MQAYPTSVFAALGDETRARILRDLAAGQTSPTPTTLADRHDMSRQAIAKHLAILESANLVESERRGRTRIYSLRTEPLDSARRWIAETEKLWDARLARLRSLLED